MVSGVVASTQKVRQNLNRIIRTYSTNKKCQRSPFWIVLHKLQAYLSLSGASHPVNKEAPSWTGFVPRNKVLPESLQIILTSGKKIVMTRHWLVRDMWFRGGCAKAIKINHMRSYAIRRPNHRIVEGRLLSRRCTESLSFGSSVRALARTIDAVVIVGYISSISAYYADGSMRSVNVLGTSECHGS
jgi:hypothetical protein